MFLPIKSTLYYSYNIQAEPSVDIEPESEPLPEVSLPGPLGNEVSLSDEEGEDEDADKDEDIKEEQEDEKSDK